MMQSRTQGQIRVNPQPPAAWVTSNESLSSPAQAAQVLHTQPQTNVLHLGAHVKLGPELGRGADATVYRATVVETGEELAVKQLLGRVRLQQGVVFCAMMSDEPRFRIRPSSKRCGWRWRCCATCPTQTSFGTDRT
jgi:hypothetical protein